MTKYLLSIINQGSKSDVIDSDVQIFCTWKDFSVHTSKTFDANDFFSKTLEKLAHCFAICISKHLYCSRPWFCKIFNFQFVFEIFWKPDFRCTTIFRKRHFVSKARLRGDQFETRFWICCSLEINTQGQVQTDVKFSMYFW